MVQASSEEIKQKWKDNILQQRQSGLSIASWCNQNKIVVHSFYYWRDKLFPKQPLNRAAFTEIIEKEVCTNPKIILEYQGFSIHLDQQFDPCTLRRCLEVLKKC